MLLLQSATYIAKVNKIEAAAVPSINTSDFRAQFVEGLIYDGIMDQLAGVGYYCGYPGPDAAGKEIVKHWLMKDSWTLQYELVQGSRAVLLDYCDTIQAVHFTAETDGFGRAAASATYMVHNGHVYRYWIDEHAARRK